MRRFTPGLALIASSLLVACGAGSTASPAAPASPAARYAFSGAAAFAHAAAVVGFGPRFADEPGHSATIAHIADTLTAAGYTVRRVPFTSPLPGLAGLSFTNVLAHRGPLDRPVLLFGAHFDSLPVSPNDPDPVKQAIPLVGANDNAGGVGCLLELARALAARNATAPVAFAFLDAEERLHARASMFAGSRDLAARVPELFPTGITGFVLLDMIADADLALPRERFSDESAPALLDAIYAAAAAAGSPAFRNLRGERVVDDHVPFIDAGYPAVDLIDFDYPPWHTTGDTLDKISAASLDQVGRALEQFVAGAMR